VRNGAVPSAGSTASTVVAPVEGNTGAGLVVPVAKPIGRFTTAQVKYAYETTRKLLIAAGLDRQTLLGGAPTAFANLLTQGERAKFVKDLNKIGLYKMTRP
jgi:hypothetical protein